MSLSADECVICNQALDKIGDKAILTAASQSSVQGIKMNLFYAQTRDSLLRSYTWSWAETEAELEVINNITLDLEPLPSAWSVGSVITGVNSGSTATVLSVTSNSQYEIVYLTGKFLAGEIITDGIVQTVYRLGIPVTYNSGSVFWYNSHSSNDFSGNPVVAESIPANTHWSHQFQLPDECIRVDWSRNHPYFKIEGRRLFSNRSSIRLHYVQSISDTSQFDQLFTEVLILRLALKMSDYLSVNENRKQGIMAELREAISRARAVMAAETNSTGASTWNLARYGSGKIWPLDPTKIY